MGGRSALRVTGLASTWLWIAVSAGPAHAANSTPYFLFDGDHQTAYEIVNGAVVNTFSTFSIGYPVAVRDTIWLGDLYDSGAVEYQLDGTASGNTSTGGGNFDEFFQVLDGAAGPSANYGVGCCASQNSVTVASLDWSNQQVLFDPDAENYPVSRGDGIAYDTSDDTLYVATLSSRTIIHYDLAGNVLDSFVLPQGQGLVALAYEQSTDTLWGFIRSNGNIVQIDKSGNVLQEVLVSFDGDLSQNSTNIWGGEMVIVPEPAPAMLLALGVVLLGSRRRRPATRG